MRGIQVFLDPQDLVCATQAKVAAIGAGEEK
jgi:hypothetical protein